MSQHGTSSSFPADPPLKRRRGRPRKDDGLALGENTPTTPGADSKRKNKQIADSPGAFANDMVGQMVYGVIDGSFDAGYLLKVKLRDSDTHLRGVVFLPGQFTPVTAANDVAPQAKMYRRTEIMIPVPNQTTQATDSFLSFEQHDKQPSRSTKLLPTIQDQGLPSELMNVPIAQENQLTSTMLSLTGIMPMYTGPSSEGHVISTQILESGLETQSTLVVACIEHDKGLQKFDSNAIIDPDVILDATELSESAVKSAAFTDNLMGTDGSNHDLQCQQQPADHDDKPYRSFEDGAKSPSLEYSQVHVIAEGVVVSSVPIGINSLMEEQMEAAPQGLVMEINSGDNASHLNGTQATHNSKVCDINSESAPIPILPVTMFEMDITPESKFTAEASHVQSMVEPQSSCASGTREIAKAGLDPVTVTTFASTLSEGEAVPWEVKLAEGAILPRATESQFFSSSGATKIKDAVPPAET